MTQIDSAAPWPVVSLVTSSRREYVFSAAEEARVVSAGTAARGWGIVSIAIGALVTIGMVVALAVGSSSLRTRIVPVLLIGPAYAAWGIHYHRAGAALQTAARSGRNLPGLLDALVTLRKAIRVEAVMTCAAMSLVAIGAALFK